MPERTVVEDGGRTRYVRQVSRALEAGRGALVLGGAGVGKTYVTSLALRASGRDLRATGPPAPSISLPTAPLTTPFTGVTLLLGLDERPTSEDEAVAALHRHLSARADPVLRIEDAHLLDPASAETLALLARRGDVVLVATARPVSGSASPWHELWRDDVLERVDIEHLSLSEAEAMLTLELGGPARGSTVRSLWNETRGNAMHLHELVADQRDAGILVRRDGTWTLLSEPIPGERLLEATRRDLAGLSDQGMRALQALALLGPLTLGTLLDVVEREAIDDLLQRGLIHSTSSARRPELLIELAHRLLGQAVAAAMPQPRRRAVLEQLADGMAQAVPSGRQTVMVMLGGGLVPAFASVRAAIRESFVDDEPRAVVTIVEAVLGATGSSDLTDTEVVTLLLERASAQRRLGDHDAALADLDAALPHLRHAGDQTPASRDVPHLITRLARLRADLALLRGDTITDALEALTAGASWLAVLPPRPGSRPELELEVARLSLLGHGGEHARAQDAALRVLEEIPSPRLALPLVYPTGLGLLQAGRFDDAWRVIRHYRPLAAANSSTHPQAATELAAIAFFAQLWAGEIAPLEGLVSTGPEAAHSPVRWPGAHASRGLVAASSGAWSAARRELQAANLRTSMDEPSGTAGYRRAAEALAAAAAGETHLARSLLAEVDAMPRLATAVLEPELRLVRLDTLIWLQAESAAVAARALAEWAAATAMARIELEALHRVLVLGRSRGERTPPGVIARLHAIQSRVRSRRAAALVQHADALHAGDADLAGIAERELNRRGLWLPPGPHADALTAREREIAALAGSRLTSRVIATRLGLSARTVDSHLASVFTKLGIRSREDLSDALH